MGCIRLFSSSRTPTSSGIRIKGGGLLPGDPNPNNFKIQTLEQFGKYVIAHVIYPDAKNYEGLKISLYKATTGQLLDAKYLDPHFSDKPGPLVPIARFEATANGVVMARRLANSLTGEWPP